MDSINQPHNFHKTTKMFCHL